MIIERPALSESEARLIDLRMLAHLGDAVFHLFERERQILSTVTVKDLHNKTSQRASASGQAELLAQLDGKLSPEEKEIVRRAGNIRLQGRGSYRKSTAFEALLGYLYLTNGDRLRQILAWTLPVQT